jgi:tetratricopeptide (TPR) repeat protein
MWFGVCCVIVIAGYTSVFSQTVSDEARRHFDRGTAAVELAKSPADYEVAIKEFQQAISLAPEWANAYYNLGKVQAQAEKFADAIAQGTRETSDAPPKRRTE